MKWRLGTLMLRSLWGRKRKTSFAVLALAVASATATALLTLNLDLESKLTREFRHFGANVVVKSKDGAGITEAQIAAVRAKLRKSDLVVPFAYAVARNSEGDPVIVAGTDFSALPRLNSWWKVAAWPTRPGTALVGARIMEKLSGSGSNLEFRQRSLSLGSLEQVVTGGPEDNQVFIPLGDFTQWTGIGPTTLQIVISGNAEEIESAMARIRASVAGVEVEPVRQVLGTQVRVLESTESIFEFTALVIAILVAFSIVAMMTASLLERRRDFALMKALGASTFALVFSFLAEAAIMGISGGLIGYVAGTAVAMLIGQINFHASVEFRWAVAPEVLAGTLLLALASAILPMFMLHRVQPATMLKGE
jgi:putative ABC transport system permease protein